MIKLVLMKLLSDIPDEAIIEVCGVDESGFSRMISMDNAIVYQDSQRPSVYIIHVLKENDSHG